MKFFSNLATIFLFILIISNIKALDYGKMKDKLKERLKHPEDLLNNDQKSKIQLKVTKSLIN